MLFTVHCTVQYNLKVHDVDYGKGVDNNHIDTDDYINDEDNGSDDNEDYDDDYDVNVENNFVVMTMI